MYHCGVRRESRGGSAGVRAGYKGTLYNVAVNPKFLLQVQSIKKKILED